LRLSDFIAIIFSSISFVATNTALREVSPVTLITTRVVIGAAVLFLIVRVPRGDRWR